MDSLKYVNILFKRYNALHVEKHNVKKKLRLLQSNNVILINELLPKEKLLMKYHQMQTKLENYFSELLQVQKDIATNFATKGLIRFGAKNSALLKEQNEIANKIEITERYIQETKREIRDLEIQNNKIVNFLKLKNEYFIPESIPTSERILNAELNNCEKRIKDLDNRNNELYKNIISLSNTYAIKLPESFIKKNQELNEKRMELILPYIKAKLTRVRVVDEDLKIIKEKVDSLRSNVDWRSDIVPYLPSFKGLLNEDYLQMIEEGKLTTSKKQYPYIIWGKKQWKLYLTYLFYRYFKGYYADIESEEDAERIDFFIDYYISSKMKKKNPKLYEMVTSGREYISINDIYRFMDTYYSYNMRKYLERKIG